MSAEEVAAFLAANRELVMSTVCSDGSIHLVAMWYGLVHGQIVVTTKAKSQKVLNLRRDPRLTVLVDAGDRYDELRGVELVGRGELVDDPDALWPFGVAIYENNYGPYSDDLAPVVRGNLIKRVGIRLQVERVVSWDHRKMPPRDAPR